MISLGSQTVAFIHVLASNLADLFADGHMKITMYPCITSRNQQKKTEIMDGYTHPSWLLDVHSDHRWGATLSSGQCRSQLTSSRRSPDCNLEVGPGLSINGYKHWLIGGLGWLMVVNNRG